jgi:hypothetical protein
LEHLALVAHALWHDNASPLALYENSSNENKYFNNQIKQNLLQPIPLPVRAYRNI